ncbi:MAG: LysM peptidoglycan-binding domain-containing protein [Ruminococcus sp.]|jgi:nucleoid-associated protein YgaU
MIEIIYNEMNQGSTTENGKVNLPNNIRQIGESRSNLKIYLEDYAYTYLKRLSASDPEKGRAAVLLGEIKWEEPVSYIFVKSALEVECAELAQEHMDFKDAQWDQVHKDMEKYFPDQEIIGWSLSLPGFDMEITDVILKTHLNHFAGNQKILFAMEPVERDEAFFVFENGKLKRQNGYYIYYEKNEPMQAYMIDRNGNASIENKENVTDRAVVDFRKIVAGKKEKGKKNKGNKTYVTGVCAAAALLVVGFTFLNQRKNENEAVEQTAQNDILEMDDNGAEGESMQEEAQPSKQPSGAKEDFSAEITEEPSEVSDEEADGETPMDEENETAAENQSAEDSTAAEPTPEENQETTTGSYERYVVKKGDTLTKISEMYYGGIQEVQEICEINNLTSEDLIYAGQIILLP